MRRGFKIVSLLLCFILLFDLPMFVMAQNEDNKNTAYVILGDDLQLTNVTQVSMGTSSTITTAEKGGKKGWQLNSASTTGAYLNIDLPDSFSNTKTEGTEYVVEVDYFDTEKAVFCLKYDAILNPVKEADLVYLGTSQTWKTASFVLDDAYFGNRMEGSDLRICVRSDKIKRSSGNVVISKVTIKKYPKKHPVLVTEIKTEEVGNIFGNGEDKKFNVTFVNNSNETRRDERMENAKRRLSELAEYANTLGLTIAVETLPRLCLGNSTDEMEELMKANDKLRICFDVNHIKLGTQKEFLERLGDKIVTLHISDYIITDDHFLPFEGNMDWKEFIIALDNANYNGVFMYEAGLMTKDGTDIMRDAKIYYDLHKKIEDLK
ncbi:MAG: sugar phosphate isomerase/epimerase [Ruminococcaceae bacterium]|nr:sugar phosphate isomerase/epimerase [Oscillospiraceae bacterium]